MKDSYEQQLKMKDDQIVYYKDLKAKLSTKMVGESLEEHCRIEFEKLRQTGFQRAYFEKDNDIKNETKGDFIFRDSIGRIDLPGGNLSMMIESIDKIKKYNRDIVIYPGHGDSTSLGYEIDNNIYFKNIDLI